MVAHDGIYFLHLCVQLIQLGTVFSPVGVVLFIWAVIRDGLRQVFDLPLQARRVLLDFCPFRLLLHQQQLVRLRDRLDLLFKGFLGDDRVEQPSDYG